MGHDWIFWVMKFLHCRAILGHEWPFLVMKGHHGAVLGHFGAPRDLCKGSAVKTVAAWRQCREESYQKVRKVIENVCFSPMYFLTFYNFPQQFPHFFLLLPPFFLCHQSCSNIFPHSFPHFSSQFSSFFCITFLIFSHNFPHLPHSFPHFSSQRSTFFFTLFLISPHNFPHFSSFSSTLKI